MSENNKVLGFVLIMCVVVATLLAGLRGLTLEMAQKNEAVFNQRAILKALGKSLQPAEKDMSDEEVQTLFATKMTESKVIDYAGNIVEGREILKVKLEEEKKKPEDERVLPFFVFNNDGEKYYIMSMRGNGLWDAIWGNMSLKADLITVAGASFDHKGETPGLGAEIKDNQVWVNQFIGTNVYKDNKYSGITVRKGGAKDKKYEVDGLSGATVTADGVDKMIKTYFTNYEPFLNKIKGGGKMGMK
ncbi:MAG: Na+-transporting NADH:ubiquinone oxidoreductase subunit C [Saprospiraceae bacterium]|jgi:Na+-transporting NADH:ubiquinone oxidoreductase subunit C